MKNMANLKRKKINFKTNIIHKEIGDKAHAMRVIGILIGDGKKNSNKYFLVIGNHRKLEII